MSLHKQPGKPHWFCAYTIWDPVTRKGRRVFRSTNTSDEKQAKAFEEGVKKAAKKARDGTLNAYTARQLIEEVVDNILHALSPKQREAQREAESKSRYTIKAWMEHWLETKKNEVEPSTLNRYQCVIDRFVAFLGTKSNHDIAALDSGDVLEFRDDEAKTLARETANLAVRVLRTCFGDAMKQNLNYGNPAVGVKMLKGSKESRRRAFTLDEIKRILKACEHDVEWRGLVIFGLYLGQRLRDLARLTWRSINLENGEVSFVTQKTGRRMNIPMMQPVLDYLTTLPASDDPNAFIFPKAAKHKYVASLSNQFREILIDAGLAEVRDYGSHLKKQNPIRTREVSEISFHSLRHSAVTLLKAAGVSDFIAREIVGHESAAVSRQYSHLSTADKKNAMRNLPDVTT